MKSVRESYVRQFGEDAAQALESAARKHKNGIHDQTGSDPFKWAVAICIGYQCVEVEGYRKHHGITHPTWENFKNWVKWWGELDTHDGDVDFLSMFAGVYDEYMPEPEDLAPVL